MEKTFENIQPNFECDGMSDAKSDDTVRTFLMNSYCRHEEGGDEINKVFFTKETRVVFDVIGNINRTFALISAYTTAKAYPGNQIYISYHIVSKLQSNCQNAYEKYRSDIEGVYYYEDIILSIIRFLMGYLNAYMRL